VNRFYISRALAIAIILIFSAAFPVIGQTLPADGSWQELSPAPQSNTLRSIYFTTSSVGWAAGDSGTIIKTSDGGATWSQQTSGTTNNLNCIRFVDSNTGWAAGKSGVILKTTNGGSTWSPQSSGVADTITSIYGVSTSVCYATAGSAVLKTTDGGATWIALDTGAGRELRSISFLGSSAGWAAGDGIILKTTNGGITWQACTLPSGCSAVLRSIYFLDTSDGWAAGDGGIILRTIDGGTTWTSKPSTTTSDLYAIRFVSWNTGWAVGDNGTILKSTDTGLTWLPQVSGTSDALYAVHPIDTYTCWAAGYLGEMLRTSTGGMPGCVASKLMSSGKTVDFGNLVVTAKLPGCIYAEHPNRTAGIRVNTSDTTVNVGDLIYIRGTTTASGAERAINATSISIITHNSSVPAPLGMANKSVGGGKLGYQSSIRAYRTLPDGTLSSTLWQATGLNNTGLLVRTWGLITPVDYSTFSINDGFGLDVKCILPSGMSLDPSWSHATVTGISSCEQSGSEIRPVILVTQINGLLDPSIKFDQSPFGVNFLKWEFMKSNPNFINELTNRIKVMKAAGVYWDRDGIGRDTVNPSKDGQTWDWNFTDQVVNLCQSNGINLIPILSTPNTSAPLDAASRAIFANYIYAVVNRYKGSIKTWEIWNEPNDTTFWSNPNVAAYTLMLIEAYKAAKRADPTCMVIAGGVVGIGLDWWKGIHDNGGWDYCDGVAIHPYAQAPNPIQQRLDLCLRNVNNFIAGYEKPKPVWITEAGWKTGSSTTEEMQAVSVFQTYVICMANKIQNFDYFCMDNYDNWGLIRDVNTIPYPCNPKSSYTALKLLTQALGSPGPAAAFDGYLQMPANVACYVFRKPGTSRVLILWNNDGLTRTIQLPQTSGLTAIDILNRPVTITNGALTLGADPIIVTGADATLIGTVSTSYNPHIIAKGTNIIFNGTLDCTPPSNPGNWSVGRFNTPGNTGTCASSTAGRNGSTCVSVTGSTGQGAWSSAVVPVEPGKSYRISGWVKTNKATGTNCISIAWYAGNMFTWRGESRTQSLTGTNDWTYVTASGTAGPDTAFIHVFLESDNNTGTTWFDDVSVVEE